MIHYEYRSCDQIAGNILRIYTFSHLNSCITSFILVPLYQFVSEKYITICKHIKKSPSMQKF